VGLQGSLPDHDTIRDELDARFRASLLAYFHRRTGNIQEAEDLTQETFIRLIRSEKFQKAEEANAFVFRVATNLLRDRARAHFRHHARLVPLDPETVELKLVEGIDPERVFIAKESLSRALTHLAALSERTRNIFVLFRVEGMKQKDIASAYGISVSAVEKHIMTATVHLAKRFGSAR
jgi:RNA polymerase sigma-70 factor (ECF subfamily)